MENKSIIGIIVAIVVLALVALFIGKGGKKEEVSEMPQQVQQQEESHQLSNGTPVSFGELVDGTYNMTDGKVFWKAEKTGGSHHGVVTAPTGKFVVKAGKVVSGTITVDMNTIVNTDGGSLNQKLVDHLKSADFFNVAKNPLSTISVMDWSDQSLSKSEITILGKKSTVTHKVEVAKNMIDGKESYSLLAPLVLVTNEFGIGQTAALKTMLKNEFTTDFIGTFELKK